jgi:hypothetical protein
MRAGPERHLFGVRAVFQPVRNRLRVLDGMGALAPNRRMFSSSILRLIGSLDD